MTPTSPFASAQALLAQGRSVDAEALLRMHADDPQCAVRLRELLVGERRGDEAAQVARPLAAGDSVEGLVSQAVLRHLAGDCASAALLCQKALALQPTAATALNHLGRALHNLGRTEQALAAFEEATALDSHYPEAWHNLGHALRARGQTQRAAQAFQRALELTPGYDSARLNLGITLYAQERAQEALDCYTALLQRHPDHVEALVNAGLALHLLGRLDESRRHYEHALQLAPQHAAAQYYYGCLLNELQDVDGAIAALQAALRLDPHDADAWAELAGVHEQSSRLDAADDAVRRGLALQPTHPALNLEAAKLERRRGDAVAAAARLQRIDPRRLPTRLAQQLQFELGQALDRVGDVDAAMRAFTAGNQLAARSLRRREIDPGAFERQCIRLEHWLQAGAPGAQPQPGDPQDDAGTDLCFLFGFPRSGTTLLDTMLDAHADIASIEEQPTLEFAIEMLRVLPGGYPQALALLTADELTSLRQRYRTAAQRHLDGRRAALIVDKLPLRSLHAALIHRLFPQAKLLFALRHPCDVVLSNFMQQYAVNEAFIHFDTLADAAAMYDRVLSLWQRQLETLALPHAYLRYEALIAYPAAEFARVCTFLGIAPDPAMLDDQARRATRERVRTNSYQQVAEPVYTRAAGRWQRYRDYLQPQLELLRPHAERFGYSIDP